jgi:YhcH/YjgK/YiaL family protein
MIIDRIENASHYYGLGAGIAEALMYLKNKDLFSATPGSYEIVKDKVRMIVSESEQINTNRIMLEAHQKNIDVQYWISGSEMMGHTFLRSQKVIKPYNEENDCSFYAGDASFSRLEPGMFAIYFPTDLHTAVRDEQCDSAVRKIVFKVIIE